MSVHRSEKVLDVKTEYLLDWLTRAKADSASVEEALYESNEKKFDRLIDELRNERKKLLLYKPSTSR